MRTRTSLIELHATFEVSLNQKAAATTQLPQLVQAMQKGRYDH